MFTSHKKKHREGSNRGRSSSDNPEFDLKEARFEFGSLVSKVSKVIRRKKP